uniref:NADH dehydrogenase subunit 2 n=1 Tax=Rodentolepis nana TaxID=102285 RepID=A0A0R3T6E5_RODNA
LKISLRSGATIHYLILILILIIARIFPTFSVSLTTTHLCATQTASPLLLILKSAGYQLMKVVYY